MTSLLYHGGDSLGSSRVTVFRQRVSSAACKQTKITPPLTTQTYSKAHLCTLTVPCACACLYPSTYDPEQ